MKRGQRRAGAGSGGRRVATKQIVSRARPLDPTGAKARRIRREVAEDLAAVGAMRAWLDDTRRNRQQPIVTLRVVAA